MAKAKQKNQAQDQKITFEAAIQELEARTVRLEQEGLSLEESLKTYEEGIQFARICASLLEDAENRIRQLTVDKNGAVSIENIDEKQTE